MEGPDLSVDESVFIERRPGAWPWRLVRLCPTTWAELVELLGRPLTLAQVPIARLSEIVVHHLDLDCGFDAGRLDSASARWLLQWAAFRYAVDADLPALRLESTSGLVVDVGPDADRAVVTGADAALWSWLTGRTGGDDLEGADGLAPALRS